MSTSNTPDSQPPQRARIPHWTAPFFWIVGTLLVHVGLPWFISFFVPRYGWADASPGWWNLIGLIPALGGLVMIAWGVILRFNVAASGWRWKLAPSYMLNKGPYRFSRNPIYLLELVMWLGWSIFYGSIAVLITFFLWWAAFVFYVIPRDERRMEARFGETYLQYKQSVPRWMKLPWGR
jgi:protein-S-isoprenylcysteine O-methyltransferase Ste14